jgi:hypothetical protein
MDDLYGHPEKARLMGASARQRYEELFTGARMGERYADAYRRILASQSAARIA